MARKLLCITALAGLLILPASAPAALKRPALESPAPGATVQSLPTVTWRPVKGAELYEVQVAADDEFGSIVTGRAVKTANTAFTTIEAVADGDYFWRVRAISPKGKAGKWSAPRAIHKAWTDTPTLLAPVQGETLAYPSQPVTLRWSPVRGAAKYRVFVGTDASLATSVLGDDGKGIDTSGTVLTLPIALPPGRYSWAVVPLDAQKHPGSKATGTFFGTSWADGITGLTVADPNSDPRFSWNPVPGATGYDVEINYSEDFATSSKVCCDDHSFATTVSPTRLLANNTYYWRVRALDVSGNAGKWYEGPPVTKLFDAASPSIPSLRVRDNLADPAPDGVPADGVPDTPHPVVDWAPVSGAELYEVQVTPHSASGCDWTQRVYDARDDGLTASTAWAPKASTVEEQPGSDVWPRVKKEQFRLIDNVAYCVRVLAIAGEDENRAAVTSEWTQVGGANQAAFRYQAPDAATAGTPQMGAADYVTTPTGTVSKETPLFTWKRLPSAASYWVVISRDPPVNNTFTNVVEVGFTTVAAYAPRDALTDETSHYYWAVLPAKNPNGSGVFTGVSDNVPQSFDKASDPPVQSQPEDGGEVLGQPQFRWSAAQGAGAYRLQVAADPTFSDPIEDVTTAATSFTPTRTYPVDTVLHWRVRGIDGSANGLTWSARRTFRRRLPTPVLDSANPSGGSDIPVLAWQPAQGASGYDLHVEQADGTRKTFSMAATAFTPVTFYGTGVWRWQVRATFPGGATGPYTELVPYTRSIPAPPGAQARRTKSRIVLDWKPATMAESYRVEVSDTTSFARLVERANTDLTTWAPNTSRSGYRTGGTLYWRVAALDEGNNVGAFSSGTLTLAKGLRVTVSGSARRGRRGALSITVRDYGRRAVKRARVRLSGAGVRASRKTPKSGRISLPVKPRKKGTIVISASKNGFTAGSAKLVVK